MDRYYENWLEAYMEYTQHSEAPDVFHRWTGIATIAGALRRRVRIEMGYFRWFPNFFICFVAPPGIVSKSTTADIGMSLLRNVPDIKFGPSAVTWQALITALVESREDYPCGDNEFMPMCALTVVASELGSLIQPGDQAMITALTDLWDGKDDAFRKKTKKDGDEVVENPWLNLIGCTTPSWIAENFNSYFLGGGFASRTLFVYAEHKRQLVAYPLEMMSPTHMEMGARLTEDLKHYATLQGPYRLTKSAIEWGTEWYRNHYSDDNPLRLDKRFGGYFARKQSHLHKTAMVLAVSRSGKLVITAEDLILAEKWLSDLEPNIMTVFGQMNRERITDQMATVLGVIRQHTRIRKDKLYTEFVTKLGFQTFSECLNGLVNSGLVLLVQVENHMFVEYNAQGMEGKS